MRVGIIFASTSGGTRTVSQLLSDSINPGVCDQFDLAKSDKLPDFQIEKYDLVILGSPTYGTGDWHYNWQQHGDQVIHRLHADQKVALFTLADSRGHPNSFAGGLRRLFELTKTKCHNISRTTDASAFVFKNSPALIEGRFPGLVIEYRRQHRSAHLIVSEWLSETFPAAAGERARSLKNEGPLP